jgi:hypothetical protein
MSYESPTGRLESPTHTSFQQKTAQARRQKFESLMHELNNFSQKDKSQTKQKSHKPTKKLSLPPLKQKQKTAKAKQKIAQA